jgi:hypothetical protein
MTFRSGRPKRGVGISPSAETCQITRGSCGGQPSLLCASAVLSQITKSLGCRAMRMNCRHCSTWIHSSSNRARESDSDQPTTRLSRRAGRCRAFSTHSSLHEGQRPPRSSDLDLDLTRIVVVDHPQSSNALFCLSRKRLGARDHVYERRPRRRVGYLTTAESDVTWRHLPSRAIAMPYLRR